jgi:tRNA threonylcarbamoyladenosine biosynthesis protein TsaB
VLLLALDTSTAAVTVALHDGDRVLAESQTVDARRHAELVAPAIVGVLDTAGADRRDLTGIAVGVGPGPFTGLRIGLVTARTLGAVLGVPVQGVCSLDIIAAAVSVAGRFVVATDARRREVYWAAYDGSRSRTDGPAVVAPADVATELPAAGTGALLYSDAFGHSIEPEYPSAGALCAAIIAGQVEILPPDPLYLRRPDATPPGPRKSVLTHRRP